MKAVNILKKILTACAILIVFAGCSDFETDSPAAEAGLYVVKGSVSMEGSTAARTATSTSTKVFDSSLPWKFAAHKYSGGEVDRSVCYEPSGFYGGIFTFAFTESGEYQIEAYLASEDGQHYAYGSTVITVSEDGQQLESIVIPVELLATTEPGSVNLDIYFDDSEETAEITEMQVEWIGLEDRAMAVREALGYDREAANAALMKGEEYTLSEEVQAKLAALDEWGTKCAEGQFNTIQPVTNGHTVISLSPEHNQGIFYGTHAVKIKFMSSSGKLVYSCKEMINVYSGMTTDTWYGTSPNIVSQGNFGGKFLITGERIKRYIKPESQEPEEPEEPEAKTIKICFRFQNGEGEYAANDEIPDITMTFEEADEWSEKISENAVKAVEQGYILNEEKTDKEPVLDGDAYFINVYFDKAEEEPSQEEPEAKTIKICFRFQNGEGEYAANDEIPDITMTFEEADEWSEKISENAVKAVEQGYILNEEKTDKEPVLDGDAYFINVYFDKAEEEPSQEEPEAKTIKICFRFQNGEGEYAANDEIPDITMTFEEADEWSEKISENAVKAVEQGYILNEEKTDKEPVLDGDAYFINVYFDKAEEEPSQEEPEAKTIKICFRFQNGEGEYAAIEEIPDISMTFEEADEWSEKINGLIEENTVKAVVLGYKLNEEKTEKEPELDGDAYFVNVYFDKAEEEKANVGGVTVTLAEFDTTDLGANFTMSEAKGADGSITLTANPEEVASGYSYQWWIDGSRVDGATASSYKWTAEMLNALGPGHHYVMLEITFTSGEKSEHYSASTTFTVTAE